MVLVYCYSCGKKVDTSKVVWVVPDTGRASTLEGEPFHPGCAPEDSTRGETDAHPENTRQQG